MKLIDRTPKKMQCIIGACPAIFETGRGTFVVIGRRVTSSRALKTLAGKVGKDELVVEFPKGLLGAVKRGTRK